MKRELVMLVSVGAWLLLLLLLLHMMLLDVLLLLHLMLLLLRLRLSLLLVGVSVIGRVPRVVNSSLLSSSLRHHGRIVVHGMATVVGQGGLEGGAHVFDWRGSQPAPETSKSVNVEGELWQHDSRRRRESSSKTRAVGG